MLQKARNNPKGLRFEELLRLASRYGFHENRQSGSHHILVNENFKGFLDFQEAGNGKAKPYQVRQLLAWIDERAEESK